METQDHGYGSSALGGSKLWAPSSSLTTPALTLQAHEDAPAVERGQGRHPRWSPPELPAARGQQHAAAFLDSRPARPLGDRTCRAEPEGKRPTSPAHTPDLRNWEQNQMVALSRGIQSGLGFNGWSEH